MRMNQQERLALRCNPFTLESSVVLDCGTP